MAGRGEGAGLGGDVESADGRTEVRGGVAGVLDALGGGDGVLAEEGRRGVNGAEQVILLRDHLDVAEEGLHVGVLGRLDGEVGGERLDGLVTGGGGVELNVRGQGELTIAVPVGVDGRGKREIAVSVSDGIWGHLFLLRVICSGWYTYARKTSAILLI